MPDELQIRRATEADLPQVLRLARALARYERLEHQFVATEADYRTALFGPAPVAEAWLGFAGEQLIGSAILFHTFSTFLGKPGLYLEDLFVEEDQRGRGYGSQLFRFVAKLARERGCGRMEWSALDWNESAIGFYLGMGAKQHEGWGLFRLDEEALARL